MELKRPKVQYKGYAKWERLSCIGMTLSSIYVVILNNCRKHSALC